MKEDQRMQKVINSMNSEQLASACLLHLQMEQNAHPVPSIIRSEFESRLSAVFGKPEGDVKIIPYMMLMLECVTQISSRIVVSLAAMGPETLSLKLQVSDENLALTRRCLEESIIEILIEELKAGVRTNHLSFDEFYTRKQEEKR